MNNIILKTGRLSAIICLTSFVVWVISFIGIAVQSPLFYWTNIEDYIQYFNNNSQFFQYLAKTFMIIFCLSYMILVMVLFEITEQDRKILSKIAVVFSVMFALLSTAHYFVQISTVRFALESKTYTGLEHFLQSNPLSFSSSLNMLGWTLFLGLSSLFLFMGLKTNPKATGLNIGLLICTFSCLFGGIGFIFRIDILTFIFMNLGIGVTFFVITISGMKLLKA